MKILIDQSGKIEFTNKPTALAFSNKHKGIILISAQEKKKVQRYFREIGKIKLFIPLTFSVMIFILLRTYPGKYQQIVIDREYPGFEVFVRQKVRELLLENLEMDNFRIHIEQIGRKVEAHSLANQAYQKKSKTPIKKITAQEIISIILKNKKSGSI